MRTWLIRLLFILFSTTLGGFGGYKQDIGAKIITNDFNLNKVAELQAITVLNINELAQSVKPMVVAGELMTVRVLREGKEFNQGVAYLDDGTMVIVRDGRKYDKCSLKI